MQHPQLKVHHKYGNYSNKIFKIKEVQVKEINHANNCYLKGIKNILLNLSVDSFDKIKINTMFK